MDRAAPDYDVDLDTLTRRIIGCAIAVHRTLGPGLLESVYRECLLIELADHELHAETGHRVSLAYKGRTIRNRLVLDVLVERRVIVELKSVERIHPVHKGQLMTYLKLTGCPAGLLLNFNAPTLKAGLKRLVHPDLYGKRNPS